MESFAKHVVIKCKKIPFRNMSKYNEYMKRVYEGSQRNAVSAWKATRGVVLDNCR